MIQDRVPPQALTDARKFLGAAPYDTVMNLLYGDGIFQIDRKLKYGEEVWQEACRMVQQEIGL